MGGVHQLRRIDVYAGFFPGFPDRCLHCGVILETPFTLGEVGSIDSAAGEHPMPTVEYQTGIAQ
jgi:hypothetical protein